MNATILGGLILGVPLLLIGIYFFWRRWRTIFWMYFGALLLGLGYLTTTGALHDMGAWGEGVVYEGVEKVEEKLDTPDAAPDATPEPATP